MREALAGNVWPLIGRVLSVPNDYLSNDERNFLRALLEANNGGRGKIELRRIEKALVRLRVEGLMKGEDGALRMKYEAAVTQVMRERQRSWGFVTAALPRKRRGQSKKAE